MLYGISDGFLILDVFVVEVEAATVVVVVQLMLYWDSARESK